MSKWAATCARPGAGVSAASFKPWRPASPPGGQFGLDSPACREASIPRRGGRPQSGVEACEDGGRTATTKGSATE
jgi:hypothetical protein